MSGPGRVIGAIGLFLLAAAGTPMDGSEPSVSARRGYELLTQRVFVPAIWQERGYGSAWKTWDVKEKPVDYDAAFRERYGLHPAPYPNHGLPMGLRRTPLLFGYSKGLTADCMMCHGGSILGKSYIGLGNSSLDLEALLSELAGYRADGNLVRKLLFPFSNVRGTVEAAAIANFVFSYHNEDLSLRTKPNDLGVPANMCEDTPPWWHLKKKKRLYYNGTTDARSVRTLMVFALHPFQSAKSIKEMEPAFRDIQAYIKTLQPPTYPFAIDSAQASHGKQIFQEHCAKCHGSYGEKWTYPSKLIDLEEIGTDPSRAQGVTEKARAHYEKTWFAEEVGPDGKRFTTTNERGYIAPPLDGVWATAPYLHNGSVPTLYHLLNSKTRPGRFTRSYQTAEADYDKVNIGWKYQLVETAALPGLHPIEARKIYDTKQPGRGNQGHTFGDDLSEAERWALIEYLKTL